MEDMKFYLMARATLTNGQILFASPNLRTKMTANTLLIQIFQSKKMDKISRAISCPAMLKTNAYPLRTLRCLTL